MHGEIAATKDGKILGLRTRTSWPTTGRSTARPSRPSSRPASSTSSPGPTTSQAAHCKVTGVYTNKAPGGVAYACSFRVTEAVYLVERMVDCLAVRAQDGPGRAPAEELHPAGAVPLHVCKTGWEYDSGDYPRALRLAMEIAGYDDLRREQAERRRAAASCMGIGISFFTETVGAGPRKHMDILGLGMADGCRAPRPPDRQGRRAPLGADPGPGARDDLRPDRGRGARHPAARTSRSCTATPTTPPSASAPTARAPRPVSGAAAAVAAQAGAATRRRSSRRRCSRSRPTTSSGRRAGGSSRATRPGRRRSRRSRMAAHGPMELPDGVEGHLDGSVRVRPAQPDLPLRRLHLRRRRRPRDGPGQRAALHRRRRLRAPDQPDDRRGPGPRRPGRRRRHGAHGGDRLRRGRQLPRRLVHGLPAADLDGVPELGARRDRHAVAAPPDRGEGRRRVGHRRLARRPSSTPCSTRSADPPRRHAVHPGPGLAGDAGARPSARTWRSSDAAAMTGVAEDLRLRADRLRSDRQRFVTATVVRAERPTSAKPATPRIVLEDGTIHGFVGGECARTTVQAQALAAMRSGEALLLRITPEATTDGGDEQAAVDGAVTVHNPCWSGGALEIFLEPSIPPALVVVHGDAADRPGRHRARPVARLRRPIGERRAAPRRRRRRRRHPRGCGAGGDRRGPSSGGPLRRPRRLAAPGPCGARGARGRRGHTTSGAHAVRSRHRLAHARGGGALGPGRDRLAPAPRRRGRRGRRARARGAMRRWRRTRSARCRVAAIWSTRRRRPRRHARRTSAGRGASRPSGPTRAASPASAPRPPRRAPGNSSTEPTTSPGRGSRRRSSSPPSCPSRSCSRARPASARPRPPRPSPRCSTPRCCDCSATRASTRRRPSTSGTTPASCSPSAWRRRPASGSSRTTCSARTT